MASTALHCGGDSWELASATSTIHGYNHEPSQRQSALVLCWGSNGRKKDVVISGDSERCKAGRARADSPVRTCLPAAAALGAQVCRQASRAWGSCPPLHTWGRCDKGGREEEGAGRKGRLRLSATRSSSPSSRALTGGWLLPCLG